MKFIAITKGLLIATFAAIIGAGIFYSLAFGLLHLIRFIVPISQTEAGPSLWIFLFLIVTLVGMALSGVFAGFWGYSRYRQSLTHHSSGTPNGAP